MSAGGGRGHPYFPWEPTTPSYAERAYMLARRQHQGSLRQMAHYLAWRKRWDRRWQWTVTTWETCWRRARSWRPRSRSSG